MAAARRRRKTPATPNKIQPASRASGWVYRARFKRDGQEFNGPWRKTVEEAQDDLRDMEKLSEVLPASILTLGQAAEMVMERLKRLGRSRFTISTTKNHLRPFVEFLGVNRPLYTITPKMVEGYFQQRIEDGISVSSARAALRHANPCFTLAIKKGLLSTNPITAADLPDPEKVTDLDFFTVAEVQKLLSKLEKLKNGERDAHQFRIALNLGLRVREISDLKVGDIAIAQSIVKVKGKAGFRTVPLSDSVIPSLQFFLDRNGFQLQYHSKRMEAEYLVPMSRNGLVNMANKRAKELREPRLHFHALRHSYGTELARLKASEHEIKTLMGHSTTHMANRYIHLSGVQLAAIQAKVQF